MKVSTLILTYNEAANLPACLRALQWCDDVVVLDSGSIDQTVPIAIRHGARVLSNPFSDFASQRNFALRNACFRNDWILHLDADEIVSDEFAAALRRLPDDPAVDGYCVPLKTILFGKWLRRAGMWPTYQVRLGHARRLRFVQVGHGQREDLRPDQLGTFPEPLLHYSFSLGLKPWLEKHVRYARDEAREIAVERQTIGSLAAALLGGDKTTRRRAAKSLASRLPLFSRPVARFLYVYFFRLGFLDGRLGFWYAFMLSTYEAMTAILAFERSRPPGSNSIPQDQTIGKLQPRAPLSRGVSAGAVETT